MPTPQAIVQRTSFNIIRITRHDPFRKLLIYRGLSNLWITVRIY